MKKLINLLLLFSPLSIYAQSLIYDFEWLEPDYKVEVAVGESYQLKFNCSDNSLPFTSTYTDSWVHYDFDGGQHVVESPTGYSVNEKGVVKGLVAGSYAIKFTGYILAKSGTDKFLRINVVPERTEKESNNSLDTANEIVTKIRFGLYNTTDVDYFKYSNNNLKNGDEVIFKIHYYGSKENPFGYKWATFSGTEMVGSGSLINQDQECKALVAYGNTVYLEVYYNQDRTQYFNQGEEFVAEVYVNGIPASELGDNNDNNDNIDTKEYVDLGLPSGLLWASTNLGAKRPEESGYYYAWGETTPNKSRYDETTYTDPNVSNISGTEYDAAYTTSGGKCRIPTYDEFIELINNCTWEYTQVSSINGYKVIGKNGNSIFLPFVGGKEDDYSVGYSEYGYSGQGFYVSGTAFPSEYGYGNSYNWYLYMDTDPRFGMYGYNKTRGQTIRPVQNLSSHIDGIKNNNLVTSANIYTLDGRLVLKNANLQETTRNLPKGIYVTNGKKFIVK